MLKLKRVFVKIVDQLFMLFDLVNSDTNIPKFFKARNLFCYWVVRKLGFSATELKKTWLLSAIVSISVKLGRKIAKAKQIDLVDHEKVII